MDDYAIDFDLGNAAMPTRKPDGPQQRQKAPPNGQEFSMVAKYCIPDDQRRLLRGRARAPEPLPATVPLPRVGEIVYLNSTSAWGVEMLIYEWRSAIDVRVEVWLTYVGAARDRRQIGFERTQ